MKSRLNLVLRDKLQQVYLLYSQPPGDPGDCISDQQVTLVIISDHQMTLVIIFLTTR